MFIRSKNISSEIMGSIHSKMLRKNSKELLVYGYTRQIENDLSTNVPDDITNMLCMLYYRTDSWNTAYTAEHLRINEDINCITYTYLRRSYPSGPYYTAYGNDIIQLGDYYSCKIKINNDVGINHMYIGIVPNNINVSKEYYILSWTWLDNIYYGGIGYLYNCHIAHFIHPFNKSHKQISYGEKCNKSGDIIQMIVNFTNNNSSIRFVINGTDYGTCYDKILTKKYTYRLVVSFYGMQPGSQVELV
eukprot:435505_1